jgi:hypothetical protein
MGTTYASLRSVFGTVLAGTLVAAALILVGLQPALAALVGAVVAVDLRFYRSLSAEDRGGDWFAATGDTR